MNNNWDYLNIELNYNNEIINVNSVPKIVFDSGNQISLESTLNDIFSNMISETLRLGNPNIPNDCSVWETTAMYISYNEEKINEVIKTKSEMLQYPSYGEGIYSIYLDIIES
jgi:hypothetical protein